MTNYPGSAEFQQECRAIAAELYEDAPVVVLDYIDAAIVSALGVSWNDVGAARYTLQTVARHGADLTGPVSFPWNDVFARVAEAAPPGREYECRVITVEVLLAAAQVLAQVEVAV